VLDWACVNLVTGSFCTTTPHPTIIKQFLAQRKVTVLDHPPYSPHLTPADYFLFPKVKSHWKGRLFYSISDIQKAVTSTLITIAKDDLYKGIQKLYDHANLCVQLEGCMSKTKQRKCNFFHANTFSNASPKT